MCDLCDLADTLEEVGFTVLVVNDDGVKFFGEDGVLPDEADVQAKLNLGGESPTEAPTWDEIFSSPQDELYKQELPGEEFVRDEGADEGLTVREVLYDLATNAVDEDVRLRAALGLLQWP